MTNFLRMERGGAMGFSAEKVKPPGPAEVPASTAAGPREPPVGTVPDHPRPILLATLSVRVDPRAERMAIDSAVETGARLILANMLWLPPYPTTLILAREEMTLPHEEDLDAVRATAARAAALGIPTELLRISSRRPLAALIELVRERRPGLVVLGPDIRRTARWRLWLAARRVRQEVDCLVWIAPDG